MDLPQSKSVLNLIANVVKIIFCTKTSIDSYTFFCILLFQLSTVLGECQSNR